jgi:DNA (cytosine-5)-methyltransferase 1
MQQHIRWDISDERRAIYAIAAKRSQLARSEAEARAKDAPESHINPNYDPSADMPRQAPNGVRTLSLFSGGGGLDLGFDLAGFAHFRSYEVLDFAAKTLRKNRPTWSVAGGKEGDVIKVDWRPFRSKVDFIHGGPPCQPFSIAGRRNGPADSRDMFPEFIRAIREVRPEAFLIENVLGFLSRKFSSYREDILRQLGQSYCVSAFTLSSRDFGLPQDRKRVFLVGVRKALKRRFEPERIRFAEIGRTVRNSLGLSDIGYDNLAPTLRCTLTGPRQTTSIANSTASVRKWEELGIWAHGVSPDRTLADAFPASNGLYRLCVEECQIIQGFPLDWTFDGAVYQRLGMIGNSVCPPVAYEVGVAIFDQIFRA